MIFAKLYCKLRGHLRGKLVSTIYLDKTAELCVYQRVKKIYACPRCDKRWERTSNERAKS